MRPSQEVASWPQQRAAEVTGAVTRECVRRGLVSLAVGVWAVDDATAVVAVTALVWLVLYLVSCWVYPLRNCGKCGGGGTIRTGDGTGNWRDRPCRRCDRTGERQRWGARPMGRGAPDRHEVGA